MKFERILVFFFFFFSVLHQTFGEKDDLIFLRICNLIGITSFVYILSNLKKNFVSTKTIYKSTLFKFFIICFVSTFFVEIINNRLYLFNLIYPISFISVSFLLVKSKPSPLPFALVSLLIFIYLFSLFMQGTPPTQWVKGSRNFVSILVLYLTIVTICVSHIYENKDNIIIHLFFPLMTLIISVLALGRSGIITSVLLLLICLSHILIKQKKNIFSLISVVFIISAASYYFVQNLDYIQNSFLYKFETKGMGLDERAVVLDLYLNKIDIVSFFYSLPNLDFIFSTQGISLHNSYLNWHYSYGFGAIILVIIILFTLIKLFLKDRFLSFILTTILFRSFSDQVLLSDGILLGLPFMLIFAIYDFSINSKLK
jgi:hypothetical protein